MVCVHTCPSLCPKAPKAVTPGLCEEENGPWPCAARRAPGMGRDGTGRDGMRGEVLPKEAPGFLKEVFF